MENTYIPGVCNIGPAEIRMRMRAGWGGFVATVAIGMGLFWSGQSPFTELVLFFPALVMALGFLQAWMHFCVAFGAKGLFNMDRATGQTESVSQAEFRRADQKKVIQIWALAIVIAAIIAGGAYLIG